MRPVKITGADTVYSAPKNWDAGANGECSDLHVRHELGGGAPYICSAWQPDPEELALLNAGGAIILRIVSAAQPVVALSVDLEPEYVRSAYEQTIVDPRVLHGTPTEPDLSEETKAMISDAIARGGNGDDL